MHAEGAVKVQCYKDISLFFGARQAMWSELLETPTPTEFWCNTTDLGKLRAILTALVCIELMYHINRKESIKGNSLS